MKKAYLIIVFAVFAGHLFAQNVATINGKAISGNEFLWVFQKNQGKNVALDYKVLEAYLNLYLNFKLKVADAKSLGMDLDSVYKQEIAGYEQALNTQKKIVKDSEEYNYVMNEYREGVLMFNISEKKIWNRTPDSEDTLKAFFSNNKKYTGKVFEDIKGDVVADYQQQLEDNWIKDLRSKYTIKINKAVLKKLAK